MDHQDHLDQLGLLLSRKLMAQLCSRLQDHGAPQVLKGPQEKKESLVILVKMAKLAILDLKDFQEPQVMQDRKEIRVIQGLDLEDLQAYLDPQAHLDQVPKWIN